MDMPANIQFSFSHTGVVSEVKGAQFPFFHKVNPYFFEPQGRDDIVVARNENQF